jgi:hypothetical protein
MRAVVWLIRLEIGIWKSLYLFARRKVAGVRPGDQPFPYVGHVSMVLMGFIFASIVELPLFHVIIPWESVRLVVDILCLWGLAWMLGYSASLKVYPHLLGETSLRVRHGSGTDIDIPWERIAEVRAKRRDTEKDRLHVVDEVAMLPLLKETNVEVVLREPTPVTLPKGEQTLTEIRFHVDTKGFVAAARERLTARAG